jgi:membrane fusion protein, multidrug efflux system
MGVCIGTEGGMKKTIISLAICVAIVGLCVACIAVVLRGRSSEAEAARAPMPKRIPNVSVQVLKHETLEDRLVLTGTVRCWEDVTVSSETTGKAEWKGIEEGQEVKAGEVLYRINTESVQARYDQAEAQGKLAKQEYERAKRLVERGVATAQDLDSAVANRDVADANLRLLRIQLDQSVVKAPFDGVVDAVLKDQDEFVDTGMALARLVQVDRVKICVGIPERDVIHFAKADAVRVTLDAFPGREFEGRIHRIATTADLATHTFTAEVELANDDGVIRPGMIARVSLVRDVYPESLVIPLFASMLLDESRYVFVEQGSVAALRPIQAGLIQGSTMQVTEGLEPGEHLIVVGQYDARDGEPVNVQEVLGEAE